LANETPNPEDFPSPVSRRTPLGYGGAALPPVPPTDDSSTGLPFPRRWAGVYSLVFLTFAIWLAALIVLSRVYP